MRYSGTHPIYKKGSHSVLYHFVLFKCHHSCISRLVQAIELCITYFSLFSIIVNYVVEPGEIFL